MPETLNTAAVAFVVALTVATSAIAQELGPYRYRYGVETGHSQWERRFTIAGDQITAHTCGTIISKDTVGDRQCWTEDPTVARRSGDQLSWRSNDERMLLDLSSKRLTISNAELKFDVEPGEVPWPLTPIAQ